MSDWFYNLVYGVCYGPVAMSSRPTVVGLEHTKRGGPYLVTSNHTSPYDVMILIYMIRRHLDFVSSTEVFSIPLLGRFYGAMNAFPLDRSRADGKAVRIILDRLSSGRAVVMFPEGGFRYQERSVLHGGSLRPGVGRIARLSQTPVIPCAIEDSLVFRKPLSWLPIRRARYGVAFGAPMQPPNKQAGDEDVKQFELELAERIRALHLGLLDEMGRPQAEAATLRHRGWRS